MHGYKKRTETNDIDLVYFDLNGDSRETDGELSQKLKRKTGIKWEIVNGAYAHIRGNCPPYKSTEEVLRQWPETATCVGVRLENGRLKLVAPHGIDDLVHLVNRPTSKFLVERVKERAKQKKWLEKWPKLKFGSPDGLSGSV